MEIHTVQLFSVSAMEKLLANITDVQPETLPILKAFFKRRKQNAVPVKYGFARSHPGLKLCIGRLFGQKGSIEQFPRKIRGLLCSEFYWDLDIVNCHPVLLLQMMQKDNFPCAALQNYVEHREEKLQYLMQTLSISRDDAKTYFIKILYAAKPSQDDPQYCIDLYNEVRSYTKHLMAIPSNKSLLDYSDKQDNKYGTFLSWILQDEERKCMLAMYKYLRSIERSVDVLCYDGVMVRKLAEEKEFPIELLRNTETAISQATGYKVSLVQKPFETMPMPDEPDTYTRLKQKWEENYFWLIENASIVEIIDEFRTYSVEQAHNNFDATYQLPDGSSFISKWMKDPKRRSYRKLTMKPDDKEDSFCMFKGFAYKKLLRDDDTAPVSEEEAANAKEIQEIFDELLNTITNDNAEMKEFLLNWLAHLIQKPFELPDNCLIFTGRQGTGKDSFGNFVGDFIIGSEHFANYENADSFWSPYDEQKANKMLIKLEEAQAADNKKNAAALKARITTKTITINPKGRSAYKLQNFARYIMTTNEANPVLMEEEKQRKFVLIPCSAKHQEDFDFWNKVYNKLMQPEGGAVIGKWLEGRDITDFQPRRIPYTEFCHAAIEAAMSSEERFVRYWDGEKTQSTTLFENYKAFCMKHKLPCAWSIKTFGANLLPFIRDGIIIKTKSSKIYYLKPGKEGTGEMSAAAGSGEPDDE